MKKIEGCRYVGIILILAFCIILNLSGCATAHKQKGLEIQGLRNQISVLESQIQIKDEEIADLKDQLNKIKAEKITFIQKNRVVAEIKSRPNTKQIQIALRNAGYNPGPIDGKMGRQTRDAIRAFQRANNLVVDGKVGKQTWSLLKEYLYKKVK